MKKCATKIKLCFFPATSTISTCVCGHKRDQNRCQSDGKTALGKIFVLYAEQFIDTTIFFLPTKLKSEIKKNNIANVKMLFVPFQGAARTLGAAVQGASSAIQQQWQQPA